MHTDVVFLHGFGEDSGVWPELLQEMNQTNQFYIPDFSTKTGYKTIEDLADWLNDYLHDHNLEKVWLVGHSMGGYIGLEFLNKYPEKIYGLGLLHSSAEADSEDKKIKRDQTAAKIKAEGTARFMENFYPSMFANPGKYSDLIAKNVKKYSSINEQALIDATLAMKTRKDYTQLVRETPLPLFYILGQKDNFFAPKSVIEQPLSNPNTDLMLLSEVGHAGFYEDAEACAEFINWQVRRR